MLGTDKPKFFANEHSAQVMFREPSRTLSPLSAPKGCSSSSRVSLHHCCGSDAVTCADSQGPSYFPPLSPFHPFLVCPPRSILDRQNNSQFPKNDNSYRFLSHFCVPVPSIHTLVVPVQKASTSAPVYRPGNQGTAGEWRRQMLLVPCPTFDLQEVTWREILDRLCPGYCLACWRMLRRGGRAGHVGS